MYDVFAAVFVISHRGYLMVSSPVEALLFTCKQRSFADHVSENCCAIGDIPSFTNSAVKSMRKEPDSIVKVRCSPGCLNRNIA